VPFVCMQKECVNVCTCVPCMSYPEGASRWCAQQACDAGGRWVAGVGLGLGGPDWLFGADAQLLSHRGAAG